MWNPQARRLSAAEIQGIFVDVDGTLVSFQTHQPNPRALKSLKKLQGRGIKVCLATGRSVEAIGPLFEGGFDAYICSSGQYCLLPDGTLLRQQGIPTEDILRLCDYLEARGREGKRPFDFEFIGQGGGVFTNKSPETVELARQLHFPLYPDASLTEIRQGTWLQIMFFGSEEEEKEFIPLMPGSLATRWHPGFIDIMPRAGGKGEGIQTIADYFGLDVKKCLAIGDGENDLSMFERAGMGIAMGNASPYTQAKADFVTQSVDDDGIYYALKALGF